MPRTPESGRAANTGALTQADTAIGYSEGTVAGVGGTEHGEETDNGKERARG